MQLNEMFFIAIFKHKEQKKWMISHVTKEEWGFNHICKTQTKIITLL
jgi:hypothetical protein